MFDNKQQGKRAAAIMDSVALLNVAYLWYKMEVNAILRQGASLLKSARSLCF